MPRRRRYGALQKRVSGGLLEAAWDAAGGARAGQRSQARPVGQPVRWLNERLLGVDARRGLPAWKQQTFEKCVSSRGNRTPDGRPVTLFNDTFVNHYDPEIGIAALEILERGGCRVQVARRAGCGRPLISQGLLGEARAQAAQVVEGLFPMAER